MWMPEQSVANDLSAHSARDALPPLYVLNGDELSRCLVSLEPHDAEVAGANLLHLRRANNRPRSATESWTRRRMHVARMMRGAPSRARFVGLA